MKFSIFSTIFYILSFLFLIYLLLPGPTRVEEFQPLPNSLKSKEPGDTYQNPNTAAYFTDYYRREVIPFYIKEFNSKFTIFGLTLPFIRLNHPPQYAHFAIRPYQQSWYLEEFVHPLRESLYINGWEPFDERGEKRFKFSHGIVIDEKPFKTKVTLKYYTSSLWIRVIIWVGIITIIPILYHIWRKALKTNV